MRGEAVGGCRGLSGSEGGVTGDLRHLLNLSDLGPDGLRQVLDLARVRKAARAGLPKGAVQLPTNYGTAAWAGMCPPPGDKPHRYVFTVYAMKTDTVTVAATATAASMEVLLSASALSQASFTATYARAK